MTFKEQDYVQRSAAEEKQPHNSEAFQLESNKHLNATGEELVRETSHIKRFVEQWHANPHFQQQMALNPNKAVSDYNLNIYPEEIKPLWDQGNVEKLDEAASFSESMKRWEEALKFDPLQSTKAAMTAVKDPRYHAWRGRQIARTASQFLPSLQGQIAHAPVCFELSKGCSGGCWFCGISAPRLDDIFYYTPENAKLWRDVLGVMKEMLGPAAGAGFCYWGTDPMDNPDYEKFCSDFHDILDIFPQTTTALPLRDVERTRSLLKLSQEKGCLINRFSIISLKMLDQVHEAFTAEELAFVKLVLQNEESKFTKANAGRARKRQHGQGENGLSEQGTIACVTGFLFNMVDRSVKLISPCNADDRWPLGYIVYDEGTFSNADDLKVLLERMIADHMPLSIEPSDTVQFRRDLEYESLPDGFRLSTPIKTFNFRKDLYFRELGEVIHRGDKTTKAIISLFESYGVSSARTFDTLNHMFKWGLLEGV